MKRRKSMGLLLCGMTLVGCRRSEIVTETPWVEMKGKWEGVSGGAVEEEGEILRIG